MQKALWVVRDKITSAQSIRDLLAHASGRGIRDLVVQVRGRGDAYYHSDIEPRAEPLEDDDLDPLAMLVHDGAAAEVRIHAWANVFFVWSHPEGRLPLDARHVVHAHPQWLLRPPREQPQGLPTLATDGRKRWPDPALRYLDPTGGADWEGIYAAAYKTCSAEPPQAVQAEWRLVFRRPSSLRPFSRRSPQVAMLRALFVG